MNKTTPLHQMTLAQLQAEAQRLQDVIDDNYWRFCRCAASRCASYVKAFAKAGAQKRLVEIEIKSRRP